MKTYSVLFAEDVPHYGLVEIEAEDDAAALAAAKAYDHSGVTTDPAWDNTVSKRIVFIADPQDNNIAEDVPLDDFHLRSGGEKERILCDAVPGLLKALEICERALNEVLDIMHYEDQQPVTALDGREIERAFIVLYTAFTCARESIEKAGGTLSESSLPEVRQPAA